MDTIGERLREERKRLGLTQGQLCEYVGVARNTQVKYESGKNVPDAEYLRKVADRGLDTMYILLGTRSDAPPSPKLYHTPVEALEAVLDAQGKLGLAFTAEQMKTLLEYAYKLNVDSAGIVDFVRAAYAVTGNPLDDDKKEG